MDSADIPFNVYINALSVSRGVLRDGHLRGSVVKQGDHQMVSVSLGLRLLM